MRGDKSIIFADEGKYIGKKGAEYAEDFGRAFTLLKGETEKDFVEVDVLPPSRPEKPTFDYDAEVNRLIRERYTESAEFAILRQRDAKPEEFAEYNTFCEECKIKAKEER